MNLEDAMLSERSQTQNRQIYRNRKKKCGCLGQWGGALQENRE